MDGELIAKLADLGPWGAAIVIVFLLVRELPNIMAASRGDGNAARLDMMNKHFGVNLKMLHQTNNDLAAIKNVLTENLAVNRQLLQEMVRGQS